jgi:hypothetical protein
MLDRVALPSARAAEPTPKIDHASHRKMERLLIDCDLRLQQWGRFAASKYHRAGYPIPAAPDGFPGPDAPWPEEVTAVEHAGRQLYWTHAAALMAHYACPADLKAPNRHAVYLQLIEHFLARLEPDIAAEQRPPSTGFDMFRRNLDRGRWVIRYALEPAAVPKAVVAVASAQLPRRPFGFYSAAAKRARRSLGQR